MNVLNRYTLIVQNLKKDGTILHAAQLLQRAARLWPTRRAVITETNSYTFDDLYKNACALTHKIISLKKVSSKDRIITLFENTQQFYIAYYGAWQTGAIVTPVNTFLTIHELEHIINDAKPSVIIASEKQYKRLQEIAKNISCPIIKESDFPAPTPETNTIPEKITFPDENSCTALLYTSGTTGLPKGVMLSSKNILTNAAQGIANFDLSEHETIYAALPLFHSYMQNVCLWSVLIVGATTILVPSISRHALIRGLQHKPTIIVGIPQLYGLFALLKDIAFDHVKLFISGGDALPDKIRMAFALTYNRTICNGYGLTEASPFVAVDLEDKLEPSSCIGHPMPHLAVDIRDDELKSCPAETVGTLWIKGENIMLGYYKAEAATKKVLVDGWLDTGDYAKLTPEGKIILAGRKKDLIITNGLNVYPQEIENIIMQHPDIIAVGVIGLETEDTQVPVAFVASRKEQKEDLEELEKAIIILCKQKLASYKVPRKVFVRTQLPQTATGKVDKKTLRKELKEHA